MKETFLIIDSHALIHRAFHALPQDMTSPSGEPINAVYGFASILIKVLGDLKPNYVVAAFDLAAPTFRHEAYKEYKATREKTDDMLIAQFPLVRKILEAFKIPILEQEGFEADDVIGTVVDNLKDRADIIKVIVTGDLDTLQLVVADNIVVYTLKKGITDTIIYNEEKTKERYGGLDPDQLIDFKGLKGDPSDNIPGVPGVGEKTAIALLLKYKNLEEIYENFESDEDIKPGAKKNLKENKDQAFFSRELATIRRDAPINFSLKKAEFRFSLSSKIKDTFSDFGFKSLIRRLEKFPFSRPSPEASEGAATSEVAAPFGGEPRQRRGTSFPSKADQPRAETSGVSRGDVKESGVQEEIFDELEQYYKKGIFSKKIYELERALTPVLRRVEKNGFLIDVGVFSSLSKKIENELKDIKKEAYKLSGEEFNLNSPQEVGRILFEKLGIKGRVKRTKTGAISTKAEELEKIKDLHPIVPLLLRSRMLSKLKSTYLDALPRLVSSKDGRVHTTFKQFGAITGRLASESPNLQNIPIKGEYGGEVRSAFVAKDGYLLISADYSQIELRVAASLSGDKKMISAFKEGQDIHTKTAAEVFNVSFDEVTPEMRRKAKILNFGILYGMGVRAFSHSAGVSLDEARSFIDEYRLDFLGLNKFIENTKQKAYSQGYIETFWGRRRYFPELTSGNPGMRAAGERMAVNMPIQGTAADIIKSAMVAIDKEIIAKRDIKMILQVHDELVFEVKKDKIEKYTSLIKEKMEGVIDLVVPLVVDVKAGPNWDQMNHA